MTSIKLLTNKQVTPNNLLKKPIPHTNQVLQFSKTQSTVYSNHSVQNRVLMKFAILQRRFINYSSTKKSRAIFNFVSRWNLNLMKPFKRSMGLSNGLRSNRRLLPQNGEVKALQEDNKNKTLHNQRPFWFINMNPCKNSTSSYQREQQTTNSMVFTTTISTTNSAATRSSI